MFSIYKRELKSCLQSFIGFLFIGVTLFFLGLYYSVYCLLSGYPYFSAVISAVVILFMISVPILTMRILAEERRNKTDQLILTAPVSVGGIVVGKFLAMVTVFAIPTAIISVYPLIMCYYGKIPLGESYLSILAFFLYGITAIAIGILISSLTESQVISAVLSFAVLFLGYMMPSLCSLISSTGNFLTKLLSCFDMYTPFANLLNGTLNLKSIFYFAALTGLLLFLTVQSIQKRRYSVSVKNFKFGVYSTGMIAVAVAIVVIANIVLEEMPGTWTSVDLTSEKLYSLTDQTKEYVKGIDEDITIYVLVNKDNRDITLSQTLERYEDLSDHIKVEYVDPQVNPRFHTQYTTSSISVNSLIVVSGKRSKVVNYNDVYESTIDYSTYQTTTTGYDGEGQITSALDYVLSDNMPKMYMLEGHGEYGLSGSFAAALDKENMEYETISLLNYDEIPEDASCLLINGAVNDISADDKDKVTAYLEKGGRVVLIAAYTDEETPNLDALLSYMGMSIAEGMVVEQDANQYYRNPYYLLPSMSYNDYTNGLYGQKYYIFAPFAQGIVIENEDAEGMSYETILSTSDTAFSKVNLTNLETYAKEEGDIDGPFAVGVEAIKALEDGNATMVVYGSEQMFTDDANSMVGGANLVLFTNTISQFADHEVSVSIPVKNYEVSTLTIAQSQAVFLSVLVTVILPVGFLILGFVIWFRRRKR